MVTFQDLFAFLGDLIIGVITLVVLVTQAKKK